MNFEDLILALKEEQEQLERRRAEEEAERQKVCKRIVTQNDFKNALFQVLKARERRKRLWGPHTELRLSTDGADAEVNPQGHIFLMPNEVHSSSCVLYYLQFERDTPENAAVIDLFFHIVRVRLIATMKHEVSLG